MHSCMHTCHTYAHTKTSIYNTEAHTAGIRTYRAHRGFHTYTEAGDSYAGAAVRTLWLQCLGLFISYREHQAVSHPPMGCSSVAANVRR